MKKTAAYATYIYIVLATFLPLSASTYAFERDLTVGSTGIDVIELQTKLMAEGHLIMPQGISRGYFGSLTKNALIKYQIAHGITPALGYFGPITRAYMNTDTPRLEDSPLPSRGDNPANIVTQKQYFGKEITETSEKAPKITNVSTGKAKLGDRITVHGENFGTKVTIYSTIGTLKDKKVNDGAVIFHLSEMVGNVSDISGLPVTFSIGNSNGISSDYGYVVIE